MVSTSFLIRFTWSRVSTLPSQPGFLSFFSAAIRWSMSFTSFIMDINSACCLASSRYFTRSLHPSLACFFSDSINSWMYSTWVSGLGFRAIFPNFSTHCWASSVMVSSFACADSSCLSELATISSAERLPLDATSYFCLRLSWLLVSITYVSSNLSRVFLCCSQEQWPGQTVHCALLWPPLSMAAHLYFAPSSGIRQGKWQVKLQFRQLVTYWRLSSWIVFILGTLISYVNCLFAMISDSWSFRTCLSCRRTSISAMHALTCFWSPWMIVSSFCRSLSTSLVRSRLTHSARSNSWKNFLKDAVPIFQNISSKLSSSPSDSFAANSAELLNLKKWLNGILASLTAAMTGGFCPSAKVTIRKIFLATSLPKIARIESKIYCCVCVRRAKEDCVTNPIPSRWSMQCSPLSEKNSLICLVINSSFFSPPVSPNPGVSMIVMVYVIQEPSILWRV